MTIPIERFIAHRFTRALTSSLLGLLIVGSAHALDGGINFAYPTGATSFSYKTYDEDFRGDDLLESGTHQVPDDAEAGDYVNIDFADLTCEDGEVSGPDDSSGEKTAEILVELTWHFPNGNTSVQTGTTTLSCKPKPKPGTPKAK